MMNSKEVAKLVRQTLKDVFGKETKFSVKSDYNAVRVSWENGPTQKEVDKHIEHYCAGSFNGMEDIFEYNRGSEYGNKYIFTSRNVTEDLWAEVAGIMTEQFPQILSEGYFNFETGSWYAHNPNPNRSQVDWNRIYRQAVWNYDAQTEAFIVTDLLNGFTPDNWQHA